MREKRQELVIGNLKHKSFASFYPRALFLSLNESWKNMHFHSNMAWPPSTYDLISRNYNNWSSLNLSQNAREDKQTATENVRCWCLIV